jgi:hypothetical protein
MRCVLVTVVLLGLGLPAMAGQPGKLNVPPVGGWEAALAAVRPDLPSKAHGTPARAETAPAPTSRPTASRDSAPAHLGGVLGSQPENVAVVLADDQISEVRGGFSGLDFSVFFSGHVDSLGQTEGQFMAGSNALQVPEPVFGISNGQVNIQTHIGDFQGASGIFQIAQVPGNFNVVNQNMFIQINLLNPNTIGQLF